MLVTFLKVHINLFYSDASYSNTRIQYLFFFLALFCSPPALEESLLHLSSKQSFHEGLTQVNSLYRQHGQRFRANSSTSELNGKWTVLVLRISTLVVLLQYKPHSPIHTHTLLQLLSLCSILGYIVLFLYNTDELIGDNAGFSVLPKDTSTCVLGKLGIKLPTF